jgi:hypothetical protein
MNMRGVYRGAILAVLLATATAFAAPPDLEIPAEVTPVQGYARVAPKTNAVSVVYVALDGLYPFPSDELKDARRFVLPTNGVKAGRYRFVAVGASKTGEQATKEFAVVVGTPPQPPDPPTPPDPPQPPDPPTPAPEGFRVIFVYESSAPMTAAQQAVMFGAKTREYLDSKSKGYRRFDKDVDAANEKDADMRALWLAAKGKVTSVPCVIIAVGGKADILPLPASEDEAVKTFAKYAEGK